MLEIEIKMKKIKKDLEEFENKFASLNSASTCIQTYQAEYLHSGIDMSLDHGAVVDLMQEQYNDLHNTIGGIRSAVSKIEIPKPVSAQKTILEPAQENSDNGRYVAMKEYRFLLEAYKKAMKQIKELTGNSTPILTAL